ncbi:protein E6-like [Lolium rigidum]|uniref:protein E6-like n=1 Tax=Lolium rigidum TaxID=89674 RepID=UPI001F5C5C07|nr:protein E6-like [Lolium rigidum]
MASSASHLLLLAMAVLLAAAAPSVDAWGGRLFFSKMTRPETVDRAADATTTAGTTEALDANSAPAAFSSRPSSGGSNRGYGLYGRPEENERYPPAYFRRGVHHDAEKRTTTNTNVVPEAAAAVPVQEQEEESSGEKEEPAFPENGSGRGRPLSYMRHGGKGKRGDYGMSDTRLYQNGRYYYDVEADRYGYGRESNPVRTRPEHEDNGSGYGRPGGERRSGRYGNNEQNDDGFEEDQNDQYNP